MTDTEAKALALVTKGLFTRCDRQGFRPTYETTPLGLAVRAELERIADDL